MAPLTQILNSNLGLPPNSYIYKVITTARRQDPLTYSETGSLALISSDDSLHFIDPGTLNVLPDGVITKVNESVTCLERADDPASNVVVTAGRDGLIRLWDRRTKEKISFIQSPHKLISSLVCNNPRSFIAAGIENPDDGPNSSPVYVWDHRSFRKPILEYVESHTDTVTSLEIHPSLPTLLLSSSTDGLVNIFDTSKPDEEDALYQVINHRSAVAHAGFMFPSTDIYALGTDETVSFYGLQSEKEEEEEPAPKVMGDVRESLGCEYLAKMHWIGDEAFIAAGKHSESYLDLIPVQKNASGGPLDYEFHADKSVRLTGAHGEEVVRDVFTDVHAHTTYTCGEDGFIRAWKFADEEGMDIDEDAESMPKIKYRKEKGTEKKAKRRLEGGEDGKKARYKPY
ncbi:WD40-repeat-containing domain protein [Lophiotrema nucula]|uniref:WD40-repeat-containing domain protein n=1 Tax=Lophiotrema nucula TaxID=690887 RepID=A0A6A5Z2Z0_9PLEO|nr:WD40-repeat-containing domain protein [Lophiotrema nucula]